MYFFSSIEMLGVDLISLFGARSALLPVGDDAVAEVRVGSAKDDASRVVELAAGAERGSLSADFPRRVKHPIAVPTRIVECDVVVADDAGPRDLAELLWLEAPERTCCERIRSSSSTVSVITPLPLSLSLSSVNGISTFHEIEWKDHSLSSSSLTLGVMIAALRFTICMMIRRRCSLAHR